MSTQQDLQQRNRTLFKKLVIAATLMFGFAFSLVPLYDVICDITGLNGKTANTAATGPESVDQERTVIVEFVTQKKSGMPWEFRPEVRRVEVHPGEIKQVNFFVRNPELKEITAQAIPSISPGLAAPHFMKTECFCFNEQILAGGAEETMPMIFYLDPAIPANISTITLSYTLFDISDNVKPEQKVAVR